MKAEGSKGGSDPARETTEDAGTRRGVQGQAAEAGGWWVRATSRLAVLCTGIGGG